MSKYPKIRVEIDFKDDQSFLTTTLWQDDYKAITRSQEFAMIDIDFITALVNNDIKLLINHIEQVIPTKANAVVVSSQDLKDITLRKER